jgi:hypothetical protein
MARVAFEPTISVFQQAKTFRALYLATSVIAVITCMAGNRSNLKGLYICVPARTGIHTPVFTSLRPQYTKISDL